MTKQKTTKRALLLSALSLLMCVSMLIGTTFAWFTDSVSSKGNKIKAGNLDIQLLMADSTDTYNDISESTKPIFGVGSVAQDNNTETLWEPGKTQVAYLAIKNNGNLALKYKVALDVENVYKNLYEVMEYDIIADAKPDSVKKWESGNSVVEGMQIITTDVPLAVGATHYFALAIHMNEEAGNDYQEGQVDFDLTVLATQDTVESDSFNNQYDKDAIYSLIEPSLVSAVFEDYKAEVEVPAGAPGGNYSLDIPEDKVEITNNAGKTSMKFDMSLLNNGHKVSSSDVEYSVTIHLPHPFVKVEEILHNGVPVNNFTFNADTHTISFTTTNFSPFEVKYNDYVDSSFPLEYTNENDQYHITKGMFVGKNPVDFDATLKVADSNYIAVDFVKDGVKYYVVSERATTVFVSADATSEYKCTNGTFNTINADFRTNQSGKLYLLFGDFSASVKNNEYSTVYLLPGAYNEETVINVISNVDIIGLGDTDEVKVIKLKGSYSNKHLFNCTGTKEEYIQVTLRNLYLDANANNLNKKGTGYYQNNAAVQAIRKTMVKCYDLTINKTSLQPFIVNATNAVNGVLYPAYMYVENCSLNGTSVYDKSGDYYFYHYGLTCKGNPYISNSGNHVKNVRMDANDWIWD